VDTTDAAIVIYGSPGSLIASNHILSSTRSQMAGILMADLEPFDGDYTNTRVLNNTLEAEENALMRVAIGLGAAVLSDDMDTVIRGGVVKGNKIKGIGMGYGIVASGLEDFTVTENESTARHGGKRGAKCLVPVEPGEEGYNSLTDAEKEHGVVKNPLPTAFLRNERYIFGGEWQEDFIQGDFSYSEFYLQALYVDVSLTSTRIVVVCIDPDEVEGDVNTAKAEVKPKPVQHHPVKEAIVVRDPVIEPPTSDTDHETDPSNSDDTPHSAVFDDILLHSQARMLESIAALGKNVDVLIGRALAGDSLGGNRDKGKGRISLEEEAAEIL
jgi:hypothetical protein